MIDRDLTSAWGTNADGTLETRLYFAQNWRADTSVVLSSSGAILRSSKYTAYGKRVEVDAGDYNRDGFVDSFDYDDFMACYEDSICVGSRTADVTRDGFVDFFDYDAFVEAYDNNTERAHGGLRTLYAGYERDPGLETTHADGTLNDVYHVRHRVYSTDLGRWTRRDPLGYGDGFALQAHARAMSVVLSDLFGLCSDCGGLPSKIRVPSDWIQPMPDRETSPTDKDHYNPYTTPNEFELCYLRVRKYVWYTLDRNKNGVCASRAVKAGYTCCKKLTPGSNCTGAIDAEYNACIKEQSKPTSPIPITPVEMPKQWQPCDGRPDGFDSNNADHLRQLLWIYLQKDHDTCTEPGSPLSRPSREFDLGPCMEVIGCLKKGLSAQQVTMITDCCTSSNPLERI
jgi:RHS repeat-associated protein